MDYIIDLLLYYKLLNTIMLACGFALYCLLKFIYDMQKIRDNATDTFSTGFWFKNNLWNLIAAFLMTIIVYVALYLRGGVNPEIAAAIGVAGTYIFSILYKTIVLTVGQKSK